MRTLKVYDISARPSIEGYYIFHEGGTYTRSWTPQDLLEWKFDVNNLIMYKNNDRWGPFYINTEDQKRMSEIVRQWVTDMDFYDSVDSILSSYPDPTIL